MKAPQNQPSQNFQQNLSEADYQRLRTEISVQLKQELRRAGQQKLFTIGIHALIMLFLAVLLFMESRHHHDLMLWGIGLCLLLFSLLEFMDLDFLQSGHSLLDIFRRTPNKIAPQAKKTPPPYIPGDH